MSRYIDADAIQIPSTYVDMFENCRNCKLLNEEQVREIIDSAPSIDIVRCKECKYYAEHNELYINEPTTCVKHSTIGHYVVVKADDFCSYGEREGE